MTWQIIETYISGSLEAQTKEILERSQLPNGWLVRSRVYGNQGQILSTSITFIPLGGDDIWRADSYVHLVNTT